MKALFYSLFFMTLCSHTKVALAQLGGIENFKYYKKIHEGFKSEEDRSTLFLTLWVSDLKNKNNQTEEAISRSITLSELFQNSIQDPASFSKNKELMAELVNSIFIQQPPLFKEKFISNVVDEYNKTRLQRYLKTLTEFRVVNNVDSALSTLNDIESELTASHDKDSTEFSSRMINENLGLLINGVAARLEKSRTTDEINHLFRLTNILIDRAYDPDLEREIAFKISEALKPEFLRLQRSLGELLLVGYEKYLIKRGKIPVNPTQGDVRAVYDLIISASNQITLNRNILLAQTNLLEKGILTCNTMDVARVQRGWSWASNDDRLNIIPFVMLNKSKDEIIQESKSARAGIELNADYYDLIQNNIALFNFKFDKFSDLRRISRGIIPIIFDDPLLKLDNDQFFNGCKLIHFISREGFYKFPNQ